METDELRYKGSKVPRLIRLAWTVFTVFALVYLARHMWPDLQEWMRK